MAPDRCLIHFEEGDGPLTRFTSVSFEKLKKCHDLWINLDGQQRQIAEKTQGVLEEVRKNSTDVSHLYYHRYCYSKFTNLTNIKRSQSRCAKLEEHRSYSSHQKSETNDNVPPSPPQRKMLRSSMPSSTSTTSSSSVLPPLCIICHKKEVYITDKLTRKRKLDQLMTAETIDGGKLREAATRKDDRRILIHIQDKDCVALEVKYHSTCYKTYTSFLNHPKETQRTADKELYPKSFEKLCEIVKDEIVDNHNIWYTKRLKDQFVDIVKREENKDASSCTTLCLKTRLKERFPQLVFHTPRVRNQYEFVYVEDLSRETVVERLLEPTDSHKDTSDDEDDESVSDLSDCNLNYNRSVELKDIYMVALALRENIREYCSQWYDTWPPLSSDINAINVEKVVSPLLFNFMSWVLGYSDEPKDSNGIVQLCEKLTVKLFSICQDIVYNSSKGKIQTPKSLALAMSVRQISGCSALIQLLNGFGHCVSLSSTMAYDSAIAQRMLATSSIVPREFIPVEPTILVFDNIDFGEETKNQTHVTNGIIIQKVSNEDRPTLDTENTVIPKSQRTVEVPDTGIMPYSIGNKKTPNFQVDMKKVTNKTTTNETRAAQLKDLAYVMIKMLPSRDTILPGWTGFNTLLSIDESPRAARVGYLPVIDATPTEYSTINAILQRSEKIADELELTYATLVFDEAVYAKIQHVRWKNDNFYQRFIVRLGEFHVIMSYVSAVSKLFEDGGLKDIFIESGLVGEGSIKGVLSGKHYNRSIFCHKTMYEALQRLQFDEFLNTLDDETVDEIESFAVSMKTAFEEEDPLIQEYFYSEQMDHVCDLYEAFIVNESAKSQTFAYWSIYLQMIGILLQFVRATREVNWSLHLSSFRSMIPWFFVCDRVNYARYGAAYWLEMISLEKTHPGALAEVSENFAVQRQTNYGFSAVPCDQTIEQTANRDSKTKGGLVGFTMNRASVHRWLLSQSERAAITSKCKSMAGMNCKSRSRKDLDATKCQNLENSVCDVVTTISNMINPFNSDHDGLVNITSGVELNKDASKSLLGAELLGEGQFAEFCEKNLSSQKPDIFTKLKRNKLRTFSSKSSTIKDNKGRQIAVKSSRDLFARLLVIGKTRDIDLKGLLSFSLSEYPLSIATISGDLVKTTKSRMFELLEGSANNPVVDVDRFAHGCALVVDAMAVLQAMKAKFKTFADFADAVFSFLLNLARHWKAARLDFVADRYPERSIKKAERAKRAVEGTQRIHIYNKDQSLPKQWRKFMSCGENKESLIVFLCDYWSTYPSAKLESLESLYVTSANKCYLLSPNLSQGVTVDKQEVSDLECDHEEADTRLLLHANHAANLYNEIIIRSPDSDVLVLCTAMQKTFGKKLYLMTGNSNKFRVIDVEAISDEIGEEVCASLPGFHAFTGCDTTSAFLGKGKLKPWKLLIEYPEFNQVFSQLGTLSLIDDDTVKSLNRFVCLLYGDHKAISVDECRYNLFVSGKCSDEALPPNTDCLLQHISRSNFQATPWNQCLSPRLQLPPAETNGWKLNSDEQLEILWMTHPSAPGSLAELVECKCKTGCKSKKCSCVKSGLKCTEVCSCTGCKNKPQVDEYEESSDDESEDDDDDWYSDDDDVFDD